MNAISDIDLIQKFQDDELNEQELATFKKRFEQDPVFAKEVKSFVDISATLQGIKSYQNKQGQSSSTPYRLYMRIAAVVALLILSTVILFNKFGQKSSQELYQAYYQVAPWPSDRSSSSMIQQLYLAGEYQNALDKIEEQVPKVHTPSYFYLGNCHLRVGNQDMAKAIFTQIAKSDKSFYQKDAQWFVGLIHLKENNPSMARTYLQLVIDGDGKYQQQAQELLKDMNGL